MKLPKKYWKSTEDGKLFISIIRLSDYDIETQKEAFELDLGHLVDWVSRRLEADTFYSEETFKQLEEIGNIAKYLRLNKIEKL
jgi:hypothetical protein